MQRRRVNVCSVLSAAFRFVHREVGVAEKLVDVGFLAAQRNADACGERNLAPGNPHGFADGLDDVFGNPGGIHFAVDVFDQHREFVATQPGDRVTGSQVVSQAARERREHFIARPVTERVVDRLEVVDVDEHRGHAVPGSREPLDAV